MKRKRFLPLFFIFFLAALAAAHVVNIPLRSFLMNTTARTFTERERKEGIAVIGKRLDRFASVALVAAGARDNVQTGDRVTTHDGFYVGRVRGVSARASHVALAGQPGERFTGWLPVLSVPLDLEGWGAGLLRALVPRNFPIEEGDDVYEDATLDVLVGYVVTIKENTQGQELFIQHAINPLMLSRVRIIASMEVEP